MNQENYEIFQVATSPIKDGVNFIEASAGTGKTYAIAMLVLRAVCEKHIPIERILIVTFTRAAAEELKTRVRKRLVEARDVLLQRVENTDITLEDWLNHSVTDEDCRKSYIDRLQLAIVDIDRAGIFTIHSFCQRMLAEQALESGQLFGAELISDVAGMKTQATQDFWRKEVYPLDLWQCDIVLQKYKTPQDLEKIFKNVDDSVVMEPQLGEVADLWERVADSRKALSEWWQIRGKDFTQKINEALGEEKFKKGFVEESAHWLSTCKKSFGDSKSPLPHNIHWLTVDGLVAELNGNKFRGKKAADKEPCIKGFGVPDSIATDLAHSLKDLLISFKMSYIQEVGKALQKSLLQSGVLSFDELIFRLSESLSERLSGSGAVALRDLLRKRYDLALIDEFQDTDSKQWHIFSSLFAADDHCLYLIGDPKQAIYKFRGADIFSYFAARKEAHHFYTLATNFRSHPQLVAAVNVVFQRSDNPFLFDKEGLEYRPVGAGKDGSHYLKKNEEPLQPLVLCQLPEEGDDKNGLWSSGKAKKVVQDWVLQEILALLSGNSMRVVKDKEESILRPKDIAILVRSNSQAATYQKALLELRVPAIIAGRKTIFETEECRELLLLLRAIIDFDDFSCIKTAMTISLFSLNGDQIAAMWRDEKTVARLYKIFGEANTLWHNEGALAMLHHLIAEENLFVNLVGHTQPERRIANFNHLFEVIQEAESDGNFGPRQTLLWLRAAYETGAQGDSHELRLESDAEALQIVTMHSSKGLQYPVVFCPDLYTRNGRLKSEKEAIFCHENERMMADFGSEKFEERKLKALWEEKAEDLRLAYVAITRAELRCYLFWADVKATGNSVMKSRESALSHLLFDEQSVSSFVEQKQSLINLCADAGAKYKEIEAVETVLAPYACDDDQSQLFIRQHARREIRTHWQMTSYSALAHLSDHQAITHLRETIDDTEKIAYADLPKGARFGNALHDALEHNVFTDLAQDFVEDGVLSQVEDLFQKYGLQMEREVFMNLLQDVVTAPVLSGEKSFCLANIDPATSLKEMEFYLRLSEFDVEKIGTILRDEPTVTGLSPKIVQGYLTGFIDLIGLHEGKYYVIDYKSNYLGDLVGDYSPQNLIPAMASHNYGLQYAIYSVVLHKHLTRFVEDYDYNSHFGGVMYLFARGMSATHPGYGVYSSKVDEDVINALEALMVEEE